MQTSTKTMHGEWRRLQFVWLCIHNGAINNGESALVIAHFTCLDCSVDEREFGGDYYEFFFCSISH